MDYTNGKDVEVSIFYLAAGVSEFVGLGIDSYVGAIDDSTVLKYPKKQGDKNALDLLDLEAQILRRIGPHPHIVRLKEQREDGLLLERAINGTVSQYLQHHTATLQQKLAWMRQATEAVAAIHEAGVLHCDISVNNILLDKQLKVKLCDFQGRLLRCDGSIERAGISCENWKSYMPRDIPDYADRKTDLFALGSAFYYIIQGHEPYPELKTGRDEDEISARFRTHRFADTGYPTLDRIIHKCWVGGYDTADALLLQLPFDANGIHKA